MAIGEVYQKPGGGGVVPDRSDIGGLVSGPEKYATAEGGSDRNAEHTLIFPILRSYFIIIIAQ